MSEEKPFYKTYNAPAGGWGAAKATLKALIDQSVVGKGSRALYAMNKPGGFKCPSCAFPDAPHDKQLDFCENGAKALAFEATKKRVTPDFFAQHTVKELAEKSDYWLEEQGRLTSPMRYDAATDHYVPCAWDEAYALIAQHLQRLKHPDEAEFYTSGRTSNEAAFLYAVFVRAFGTNNFPDCSNMCHEPTSRGLPHSIGVGKSTIIMTDFDQAELIFVVGQNTGTNSPRMMSNLREARKRGVPIIVVNPMPERALMRFADPQSMSEMSTMRSTQIATEFVHIRIGGDLAFFKGVMKALFEMEASNRKVLDLAFIAEHTQGFEAVRDEIASLSWPDICAISGIDQEQIWKVAEIYAASKATILCYGMGVTQHQQGSRLIQQLANFLFLRGNIGKPGAGISPIRGHSNVQGDRTMGIDEKPSSAYLDSLRNVFGFEPPRRDGHHVIETLNAMFAGSAKVFIGMGGNFIHAVPDTPLAYAAMQRLNLTVAISTKLNRSHVIHGRDALILPVISRSEIDLQASGEQIVTIEDSMCNVTASKGILDPISEDLRSEIEIVCRMAKATLPQSTIPWEAYMGNYALIRDRIADVFPTLFYDFNKRLTAPRGFNLDVAPRQRRWETVSGRANFLVFEGLHVDDVLDDPFMLRLSTIRSHDQYNTTIYSMNDRYRGIYNDRMVVFMNAEDMKARGILPETKIVLETLSSDQTVRRVEMLTALPYAMPRGSIAGYYPELNPLLPLNHYDEFSGTPAAKSIPVIARPMASSHVS